MAKKVFPKMSDEMPKIVKEKEKKEDKPIPKGIKETTELFVALGNISRILIKHLGDGIQIRDGYDIAMDVARDPDLIASLKKAAVGLSEVPSEVKDLDASEGFALAKLIYTDTMDSIKIYRGVKDKNLEKDGKTKEKENA